MESWPNIQSPSGGLNGSLYMRQIRTEFEDGTVQSRRAQTRGRRRWRLAWNSMPEADYQTIATFFLANQGLTFYWTHPATGTVHTCRFSGDEIAETQDVAGFRKIECPIEEA